jgi:dTDP-4-amino-4,6-dideoxygalactose transaminase
VRTVQATETVSRSEVIPFHRACMGEEEVEAVSEVVRSGWLTLGPKTFEFERRFKEYIGARHAIAVSSGTAALHLALAAIGLNAGDEVLVPTTTFTATAEVVTYFKARPVLVDIDPATMNFDPGDAARRITSRTRAIIPVHFAGQPCDLETVARLADKHGLQVIEDAAHALPASYRGKRIGTISPLTAFSFYATKTLATGEGGMITTDSDEFAERIRLLRLHGISRDAWKRYTNEGTWYYEVQEAGYKYNFTDLQAALGLVQLSKCDVLTAARKRIADRYTNAFMRLPALQVPSVRKDRTSAWHLYVLRVHLDRLPMSRDRVIEMLRERGIGTSVHFIPLHLHPFYRSTYGYAAGDLPQAEREYERCLSLPIYPSMTDSEVDRVIAAVSEIVTDSQILGLHNPFTQEEARP